MPWDYLIVTASNDLQAQAYEAHIRLRQQLGLLPRVRHALVAPDMEGQRIGSGGATLGALARVLHLERQRMPADAAEAILRNLRILIVHAGGDSMRLPAYGPCGKIFVPLPGPCGSSLPATLFDRLIPAYLDLPEGAPGRGQIVVAAGDALIFWDISSLHFGHPGITMLGCNANPEEASRHGVYCLGEDNSITLLSAEAVPGRTAAGGSDRAVRRSRARHRRDEHGRGRRCRAAQGLWRRSNRTRALRLAAPRARLDSTRRSGFVPGNLLRHGERRDARTLHRKRSCGRLLVVRRGSREALSRAP